MNNQHKTEYELMREGKFYNCTTPSLVKMRVNARLLVECQPK